MPNYIVLQESELIDALATLPGWELSEGKLHRAFTFGDFSEAFAFMTRAAMDAHLLDHHPEWSNVYNRVTVDLITHAAGSITSLDIELAGRMSRYATGT